MKTPEEIKKKLEPCKSANQEDCSYCELCTACENDQEALAYIQQLEQENTNLKEMLRNADRHIKGLEAERDAAVRDLVGIANEEYLLFGVCAFCKNSKFEWRGVQSE